ncbi:MAG TPA: TIGR02757 family protein [Anaeromyxobacteraceae bacterium]|nr:TIGR02757 family protein [Anaeromyxobacteraceae bacterium]
MLSPRRAEALRPALDRFVAGFDAAARLGFDPVEVPRRYPDPGDAEVAGLLAASLAYGRADLFKPRLEAVLSAMGPSPAAFAETFARAPDARAFAFFRYRFNRPADVAALVAAAGSLRARHGSLGARFAALLAEEGARPGGSREPLRRALARFAAELREAPPVAGLLRRRGRRGLLHLLPDAGGAGACKRWNLYLRWMVRGPDAVDLGLWGGVPRSALLVPLDTHVARIGRCLGLTRRRDLSWRTAEDITGSLRRLDPEDPVRYDFALCHLGMSGACPARRDPGRCRTCPLLEVCLAGRVSAARPGAPARGGPGRRRPAAPAGSGSGRSRRW